MLAACHLHWEFDVSDSVIHLHDVIWSLPVIWEPRINVVVIHPMAAFSV